MEGNPSLEVLCRIAHALNVPIGALLGESNRPDLQVIRKEDGQIVQSDSGLSIRPLLIEGRNHRTEVYELIVPPGAIYHSLAHTPSTEEFIICVEGDLRLGPKGQEVLLKTGDSIWFPADLPHAYESLIGARAVLLMRYPPTLGTPR
jgi:quercetin dioxygenase-like cupin family protein